MPELAEVRYYAHRWAPAVGETIQHVRLPGRKSRVYRSLDQPESLKSLEGQRLRQTESRGKHILIHFSDTHVLGIHLGMKGSLSTATHPYEAIRHDQLLLDTDQHTLIFHDTRTFGLIQYEKIKPGQKPSWLAHQPPPPDDPEFSRESVQRFLNKRKKSPIKAVLLDQNGFPGLGNWMVDEILWRSRIHPATPTEKLIPSTPLLFTTIREVTNDALRVIAPDWSDPPNHWLFNHRWKPGGHCPRCQQPLARETIAGRTSCFCPQEQIPFTTEAWMSVEKPKRKNQGHPPIVLS